jgi:hypothetical protein
MRDDFSRGAPRQVAAVGGFFLLLSVSISFAQDNETAQPGENGAVCSTAGALIAASEQARNEVVPCEFDIPDTWAAEAGIDDSIAGIITHQSCGGTCAGQVGIMLNIGSELNANADALEESWAQLFPVVGRGRCGRGSVTFYSPPGSDAGTTLGSVMFHVEFADGKHSGSAQFRCPVPGEWMRLRELFINTFKTNPDSTFPNR